MPVIRHKEINDNQSINQEANKRYNGTRQIVMRLKTCIYTGRRILQYNNEVNFLNSV